MAGYVAGFWLGKGGGMTDVDRIADQIRQAALNQQGNVTRAQLLRLGVHPSKIRRRIAARELIPRHAGVYAVGYVRVDPRSRAAAAVLACGDDAFLSHFSAAAHWGMVRDWPSVPEVTVSRQRRRPGIKTYGCTTLARADRRRHHGIATTSPARTALEIAPRMSARRLRRAVSKARFAGYLHPSDVEEVLGRLPHHRGAEKLRTAIRGNPTRSGFEDDFVEFARKYGLPTPVTNTYVAGHEVDVLFPDEKVIVELDTWDTHQDRSSFEDDRERDADTLLADHETVRITNERFDQQPAAEAARLHLILAKRRRKAA